MQIITKSIKANVFSYLLDTRKFLYRNYGFLVIGYIVFGLFISSAIAHEWYPSQCCGGGDCHPVPCSEITQDPSTKWWRWVPTAESETRWPPSNALYFDFAPDKLKGSPDGMCHTCVTNTMSPMCLFMPPGS